MFKHKKFEVEIARDIDTGSLGWPERGEAGYDSGLGCNRLYDDLRSLTWRQAKDTNRTERDLIARIEQAEDMDAELAAIEAELEEGDHPDLMGLDLGVATVVVSLSAAGCVPFTSCNGGAFDGRHQEVYPLVAFYARPWMIPVLTEAATSAGVGLHGAAYGSLVVYANDIRGMREFALCLMGRSGALRAAGSSRPSISE